MLVRRGDQATGFGRTARRIGHRFLHSDAKRYARARPRASNRRRPPERVLGEQFGPEGEGRPDGPRIHAPLAGDGGAPVRQNGVLLHGRQVTIPDHCERDGLGAPHIVALVKRPGFYLEDALAGLGVDESVQLDIRVVGEDVGNQRWLHIGEDGDEADAAPILRGHCYVDGAFESGDGIPIHKHPAAAVGGDNLDRHQRRHHVDGRVVDDDGNGSLRNRTALDQGDYLDDSLAVLEPLRVQDNFLHSASALRHHKLAVEEAAIDVDVDGVHGADGGDGVEHHRERDLAGDALTRFDVGEVQSGDSGRCRGSSCEHQARESAQDQVSQQAFSCSKFHISPCSPDGEAASVSWTASPGVVVDRFDPILGTVTRPC